MAPKNERGATEGMAEEVPIMDSGERRLRELGYKQELKRGLSGFTNYGFAFSEIGVMMGVTGLYGYGFQYGGPVALFWGWVLVSIFSNFISISLGEICSSFPTVGGVYFWAYHLGGKYGNVFSWVTAWFNIIAGFANVAAVDMICADLISEVILLSTGTWYPDDTQMLGIFCAVLCTHMLINMAGLALVGPLENVAIFWDFFGVIIVSVVLLAVAPTHRSADFVFTKFLSDQAPGIHSRPYIFSLGLLSSVFTMIGYDAAAHMTEETKGADKTTGIAIWLAVVVSSLTGALYILALTFSIQGDPLELLNEANESRGYAGAQIFYDVFKARFGSGKGGIALLIFPVVAAWFSGLSCLTAASRICFAFSRDRGLPGWQIWRLVTPYTGTPLMATLLVGICAFGFALLSLSGPTAFAAVTSVVVIGFYISYLIPIFLRLTLGLRHFVRGPFHAGPFSLIFGWLSVFWIVALVVILSLPAVYPIDSSSLNYAPVTVGGTIVLAIICWFGAYYWRPGFFEGPVPTLETK